MIYVSHSDEFSFVQFIIDQKIRPEAKSLIEGELVKTQLDATLSHVKKLYQNNTALLRQAADFKTMEQRALAAESYVHKLTEILNKMKLSFPHVESMVEGAAVSATNYSESAASLFLQLSELQHKFDKLSLDHDSTVKRVKELGEEVVLKEEHASSLLFESTEKGLEIERLRKELDVAVAEAAVATSTAEVAVAEKEQAERLSKQRSKDTAAAVTATRNSGSTQRSRVQMQAELESHAQTVSVLRGRIKLLESKLAHTISKMEVVEVSRDALQVSNQQMKHILEKSDSRVTLVSQQCRETEQELQRLRESSSLEQDHLLKERKSLKDELFQQNERNSALMAELRSLNGLVRNAIEAIAVSGDRSQFRNLASKLEIDVNWSPDRHGADDAADTERGGDNEDTRDLVSDGKSDERVELDTEVAISFIGSIDKQSAPESAKASCREISDPTDEDESHMRVMPNPSPIRRLWNAVPLPDTDIAFGDDHTILSVSLSSRDVRHTGALGDPGTSPDYRKTSRDNFAGADVNVSFDFSNDICSTKIPPPSNSNANNYAGKFQGILCCSQRAKLYPFYFISVLYTAQASLLL